MNRPGGRSARGITAQRGSMNGTELAYGAHLELRRRAGEVLWYRFEGLKVRLAEGAWYTPDFAVMLADGTLECHEVKGHWEEAARVRIKVAAEHYPIRFLSVRRVPKRDGGGWAVERFGDEPQPEAA